MCSYCECHTETNSVLWLKKKRRRKKIIVIYCDLSECPNASPLLVFLFIYLFIFVPPLEGVSVKEIDVKM